MATIGQPFLCPAEPSSTDPQLTTHQWVPLTHSNSTNAAQGEKAPRPLAKPLHHLTSSRFSFLSRQGLHQDDGRSILLSLL